MIDLYDDAKFNTSHFTIIENTINQIDKKLIEMPKQ